MEQREFAGLTEAIVVRFLPRIPARYVRGFEQEIRAGEYNLAVENLVLTLVNDQIPVTPPSRRISAGCWSTCTSPSTPSTDSP